MAAGSVTPLRELVPPPDKVTHTSNLVSILEPHKIEENDSADRLDVQEASQGLREAVDPLLGKPDLTRFV